MNPFPLVKIPNPMVLDDKVFSVELCKVAHGPPPHQPNAWEQDLDKFVQ